MSNAKEMYMTQAGLEDIKKELKHLKTVRRPEVINYLKEARALGDLSENAEYDAARNEQAMVEGKIQELEALIENVNIITDVKTDQVTIGSRVKLDIDGEIEEYAIVGSKEADPFTNKISNESPIARAIIGLKVDSQVTVESPNGPYTAIIKEIF